MAATLGFATAAAVGASAFACVPRYAAPSFRAPFSSPQAVASRAGPVALQLDVPPPTFEAQGDPVQAAILLSAVLLPFGYWWYVTVPEARINLAKDKRLQGGETKAYLDELASSEEDRPVERWFFSKWLTQRKPTTKAAAKSDVLDTNAQVAEGLPEPAADASSQSAPTPPPPTPAPTLRELFQPASLKNNATPKFWSGDNPIVVTMGSLALLGVFATAARTNGALALDAAVLAAGLAFGLSRLTLD